MRKPKGSRKEQLFDKKTSEEKIASIFYLDPYREFTLSEISELAGVSKSMTSIILREMEKVEFIIINEIGKRVWRVKANAESTGFKRWKMINNLHEILSQPIIDFIEEKLNPVAIILFGSYRYGEDKKGSDIDIAIEALSDIEYDTISLARLANKRKEYDFAKGTREFENDIERNIQLHLFNRKSVDINLFNNIANGIVLSGFLEVKK